MCCRTLSVPLLVSWLLTSPLLFIAGTAYAAWAAPSLLPHGDSAGKSDVISVSRRGRGPRIKLPIGPAYIYQDYPYYYARGHYPTHIGGYVYYPPYFISRWHLPRDNVRCAHGHRGCVAGWSRRKNGGSVRRRAP